MVDAEPAQKMEVLRDRAFSLIEVVLALGIVAVAIFSGVMLLSDTLQKIRSLEQENEIENSLASIRKFTASEKAAGVQALVTQGKPVAVVFYGAVGGQGTNWSQPLQAGDTPPEDFIGGLPLTAVVSAPGNATLQPYLYSSRGSPFLVYFKTSAVEGAELAADETNGVKRALVAEALFYRYATIDALLASATNQRPARPAEFAASLAIRP